jgi:hypothetical protein
MMVSKGLMITGLNNVNSSEFYEGKHKAELFSKKKLEFRDFEKQRPVSFLSYVKYQNIFQKEDSDID